jgi:hypothetical protein
VLDPYEFVDFVLCYSISNNPKEDQADADEAYGLLNTAAKTFGIKFPKVPIYLEVKGGKNVNNWLSTLEKEKKGLEENGKTDIIFFLLKPNEQKFYSDLKKCVFLEFNCPSQVVRRKLLSNQSKGALSAASKIVMQMNVKAGHPLWIVRNSHPVWKENTVAVAGLANSKGKKGTTLAFVGTIRDDLSNCFSDCKQLRKKDDLSSALYSGFFTQWLQTWFKTNQNRLPNVLVLYREGLNEVQARIQFELEVQGLLDTIEVVKEKAKKPNYKPTILYLLVNKKPNSRIFEGEGKGKTLNYSNPEPGSVIF